MYGFVDIYTQTLRGIARTCNDLAPRITQDIWEFLESRKESPQAVWQVLRSEHNPQKLEVLTALFQHFGSGRLGHVVVGLCIMANGGLPGRFSYEVVDSVLDRIWTFIPEAVAMCRTDPVCNAVLHNNLEQLNEALNQATQCNINKALCIAVACNSSIEVIERIAQQPNFDRNFKDPWQAHEGATPLILSCMSGRNDVIRCLLDRGARPNLTDNHGLFPLSHYNPVSWSDECAEIVSLLLCDEDNVSLAYHCMRNYRLELIKCLVDVFDRDLNSKYAHHSALHWACMLGHTRIAKYLLDQPDCEVNAITHMFRSNTAENNSTVLHSIATMAGGPHICQILLDAGCDINRRAYNVKAVEMARVQENWDVYRVLCGASIRVDVDETDCLEAVGDATEINLHNNEPVDSAQAFLALRDVDVAFFLTCSEDVVDCVDDGVACNTCLHEAVRECNSLEMFQIVQRLLDLGADLNAQNGRGNTALHVATLVAEDDSWESDGKESDKARAVPDVIRFLMYSGADPRMQNAEGKTPEMMTCFESVRFRIKTRPTAQTQRVALLNDEVLPFLEANSKSDLGLLWIGHHVPRPRVSRLMDVMVGRTPNETFWKQFNRKLTMPPDDPLRFILPERRQVIDYLEEIGTRFCNKRARKLRDVAHTMNESDWKKYLNKYGCDFNEVKTFQGFWPSRVYLIRHLMSDGHDQEADRLSQKVFGPPEAFSREIVRMYTCERSLFRQLNGDLSRRNKNSKRLIYALHLDEALKTLEISDESAGIPPFRGICYRSVYLKQSAIDAFHSASRRRSEIVFGGFVSCSESKEVARKFGGNTLMVIDTSISERPGFSISSLSVHPDEREVLLCPGMMYFIEEMAPVEEVGSPFKHQITLTMSIFGKQIALNDSNCH